MVNVSKVKWVAFICWGEAWLSGVNLSDVCVCNAMVFAEIRRWSFGRDELKHGAIGLGVALVSPPGRWELFDSLAESPFRGEENKYFIKYLNII